ncbi:MAG: hypothetical protein WCP22_08845 [Chlamydiota bacterium]
MKPAVAVVVAALIALTLVSAPCRAQEQPPANAPAIRPPAAAQAPVQEFAPPLPVAAPAQQMAPPPPAAASDDRSVMARVGHGCAEFGKKTGSFFENAGKKTGRFFKGLFVKD